MEDSMTICKKLKKLAGYYNELKSISKDINFEEYKNNSLIKRAVEREMQIIVECATDINRMTLKKLNKNIPSDYYNSFIDLAEKVTENWQLILPITYNRSHSEHKEV